MTSELGRQVGQAASEFTKQACVVKNLIREVGRSKIPPKTSDVICECYLCNIHCWSFKGSSSKPSSRSSDSTLRQEVLRVSVSSRFFVQAGHETAYAPRVRTILVVLTHRYTWQNFWFSARFFLKITCSSFLCILETCYMLLTQVDII